MSAPIVPIDAPRRIDACVDELAARFEAELLGGPPTADELALTWDEQRELARLLERHALRRPEGERA